MAWSKLDIINLALNILNRGSVNQLIDSGDFADSAERAFDVLYPSEIAGYSWRFATKIVQLSVLVGAPPIQNWNYVLQLPNDYLSCVTIYPRVAFQIYEDNVIYCNFNTIQMEYRFLPNVTRLPAYFVNYFSLLLAQRFAKTVADNSALSGELTDEVSLARAQALFIDSQSHPTPRMISRPVIDVRGYGAPDVTYNNGWF